MNIDIRSRFSRFAALAVLFGLSLAVPQAAAAATSCNFQTTPAISFGTLDPLALPGSPIQVTTTAQIRCRGGLTSLVISLSSGSASSFAPRSMNDGSGHTLTYNIYTDNTYSVVFGDGTATTQTVALTVQNGAATYIVSMFGQLPETGKAIATIDPFKGTYTDTITVTATFF